MFFLYISVFKILYCDRCHMYHPFFLMSKQIFSLKKDNLSHFVVASTKSWVEKLQYIEEDDVLWFF